MDMLDAGITSFTTTSDGAVPVVWYINGTLTDPTDLLFRTKDEVKDMLFKTVKDRYDDINFDFCIIFHKQYALLKEWIEEYIFLRDEAYDIFSRNPNEYSAIRLRQISNYLDGFLEAHRLFEMIRSEIENIITNHELSKTEINILQKASQIGFSETINQGFDELLKRVESIEQERREHCSPIPSRSVVFDTMTQNQLLFNARTQYSVSGTFGTYDTETMARITVG